MPYFTQLSEYCHVFFLNVNFGDYETSHNGSIIASIMHAMLAKI
jgi:hypothetical protein